MKIKDVVICDELKKYLPPHKPGERASLVESVKSVGFNDPLIVNGDGTLVDGHNRYEIWRNDLGSDEKRAPNIVVMHFANLNDMKEFMLRKHLGRRNLNNAQRVKLVLTLKPSLVAKAKKANEGKEKCYRILKNLTFRTNWHSSRM